MPGALCVCMILKNARYLLPDALDSLALLSADIGQYVFVDTGSTDGSSYYIHSRLPGADILEYSWSDHFSEARNIALEKVKTPWALFLDADERLETGSISVLRRLLAHPEKTDQFPEGIIFRRENLDLDGTVVSWDELTRLLRVQPNLHFTGRVHERPVYFEATFPGEPPKARPLIVQRYSDLLCLRHIAVSPQVRQAKMDYYLKLIENERSQWPSPFLDYHWAVSLQIQQTIPAKERLTCLQQALKETLAFEESPHQHLPYPQWAGAPLATCILECQFLLIEMNQQAEMLAFFEAHSQRALFAESWGQAALAYDVEGQWHQAQRCFYTALDPQYLMADPSQGWGSWRSHAFLATLYNRAKDWPGAWAHSMQALQKKPQPPFESAMQDLQQSLSQQISLPDVLRLLERAFASAYAEKDTVAILSLGCFLWCLQADAKAAVFLRHWEIPFEARQTFFYSLFQRLLK